jgi:autotransporter-associated beta strand protein
MKSKSNPFRLISTAAALMLGTTAFADTLNPTISLRVGQTFGVDAAYLSLNNTTGNTQRTFLQFDFTGYSGKSVTTDATLTLTAETFGGAYNSLTGASIGTANSSWTYPGITWANQPGITPISDATNPGGTFTTGQGVAWTIPWYMLEKLATTGTAYNNGLGITSGGGSLLHFTGGATNTTLTFSAATAAGGTWTGGNGNWTDTLNWSGGTVAEGIDQAAIINGASAVDITMDANRSVGSLAFSGANHTISGGAGKLALNVVSGSPTVSVETGRTATIGATLVGVDGLDKTGDGTLTLSGANTFTGVTTISAGVLDFNVPSGSSDGASTTFSGSGTLRKTGAGTLVWNANIATFALGSGALIDVQEGTFTGGSFANESWSGNLSDLNVASGAIFNTVEANVRVNRITGSGTIATGLSGAGYQNLTIGVDNGSSTFDGVITDSFAPGNLVKFGTGTITLTGASTYTGTTSVEAGTLSLAQAFLNNNAAVVIGSNGILDLGFIGTDVVGSLEIAGSGPLPPGIYNSSHPSYSSHFTGTGSLEVLGGNGTWSSLVNGDWSTASSWSGSNVASGINSIATFNAATGVTVNLDSTRTIGGLVFGTTGYTLAGSSTLTLNTTSDISTLTVGAGHAATISAKLASSDVLTKTGVGTLTLSAQNNFSNEINVSQGTLELAIDWTFGNVGTGTAIVPGIVTVESGATLRAVNSVANQLNGLTLNGGTVEAIGVGNGDWGNFHLTGNVTATGTSNLNAEVALRAANVEFFTDTGATLNVGGVMHNGAFFGIYSGAPSNLSKSGDGTMVLSASNSYTGNTTIDAGTLEISNTGGLRFIPTSSGVTNFVSNSGSGTLSYLGTVNLDLSSAVAAGGNSWNLFSLTSFTGLTPTAVTSNLGSFSEVTPGTWEFPVSGAKWVFTENNGTLAYTVTATPYETWGSTYGLTAGSEGGDLDNDGLTNFEEYAFGLIPNSGSSVNPIVTQLDKTSGTFSYTRRLQSITDLTYTVRSSTTLAANDWTNLVKDTDYTESVSSPSGDNETVTITLTPAPTANKLFIQVRAE